MCETCCDVIRQYWPDITGDTNLGLAGTHEAAQVMWDFTAFPFCGPDQLDEQLAEFHYYRLLGILNILDTEAS